MSFDDDNLQEGHERLARMGQFMFDTLALGTLVQPGDKIIVMIQDSKMGTIGTYGYDDDADVLADVLEHTRTLFNNAGMDFQPFMMPGGKGEPSDN